MTRRRCTTLRHRSLALALLCGAATVLADAPTAVFGKPQRLTLENRLFATATTAIRIQPGGPYLRQQLPLPAAARAITSAGDMLYVAAGPAGLLQLSASGAQQHQLVIDSEASAVAVAGDQILLGAGNGLHVISTDGGTLRETRLLPTAAPVIEIDISGGRCALRLQDGSVQLLDLSDPQPPALTVPANPAAHAVALDGDQMFVATASTVTRYAISPQQLTATAQLDTSSAVVDLALRDGLLAVAEPGGVSLYDVSLPDMLHWLGSHQQLGTVLAVTAGDHGQLLVRNDQQQLLQLDISMANEPAILGYYTLTQSDVAVTLAGTTAYAAAVALEVIDFCCAAAQPGNELLDFGQGVNYGGERRVVVRDHIAYVADWFSGIHLYDIRQPASPRLLSSFHTAGSPKGVVVRGRHAFVADDDHGLQVIDVSDPLQPYRIAELATGGLAYTPLLDGDRLYLASHRGGFQIIDVSQPQHPRLLGEYATPGKAWSLQVRNHIAYVAGDDAGLLIVDVSDPQQIRPLGQFQPGAAAEEVLIDGDIAYVAFFDDGVYAVDIHDPTRPLPVGHVATPGNARGLVLRDPLLYVADWRAGLQVVDVSNPQQMAIIGHYDTAGASWGLQLVGTQALIMDWWGGFTVLDVSNPRQIRLAGRYHHRDNVLDLIGRDNIAYAANGAAGLQVFDIRNPLNPTWITGVDLPGSAQQVALLPRHAVVGHDRRQLAIVDVRNPFQAQQINDVTLGHDIDRLLASNDMVFIIDHQRGAFRYRFAAGNVSRLEQRAGHITDAALDANRLWLSEPRALTVFDVMSLQRPLARLALNRPGRVAAADGVVAIQDGSDEIRLVTFGPRGLQVETTLRHAAPLDGLLLGNGALSILSGDQITVYDVRQPAHPVLQQRYRTRWPATALSQSAGVLWLAGYPSPRALRPLPVIGQRRNGSTLTLDLPATLPLGSYDLVLDNNGQETVLHNAFAVTMPRFSKPKFTMEDLQRTLQQLRAAPAEGQQ